VHRTQFSCGSAVARVIACEFVANSVAKIEKNVFLVLKTQCESSFNFLASVECVASKR